MVAKVEEEVTWEIRSEDVPVAARWRRCWKKAEGEKRMKMVLTCWITYRNLLRGVA